MKLECHRVLGNAVAGWIGQLGGILGCPRVTVLVASLLYRGCTCRTDSQSGPLLAYLLADPELSLQSILITNSVVGKNKTAVYVALVTIFSTLSGLIFGWLVTFLA